MVVGAYPGVRLVRLEQNGGFCAAANAGMAAARGRFIQLLNNDTEVTAGWIEAGLAPFADETVGSVAPLVLVRSDPSASTRPVILMPWWAGRPSEATGNRRDIWAARPGDEVFGASGSSAFYRTEALRRAGGLDPLFGSYYEDIDLAFRLRWAGYRCVFTPGLSDPPRRLRDLRPSQSKTPAPDVPQRRAGLLVEPASPDARAGGGASPGFHLRASRLATGPGATVPVSSPASWTRSAPGGRFANAGSAARRSRVSAVRPPHFALTTARSRTSAII